MNWLLEVGLLFFTFTAVDSAPQSASFILHKNKRLATTGMKTLAIDSPRLCVNHCLAMEGCLGVKFLRRFKPNCEMTSDHISTDNLADHNNSDVYVVDRCLMEPGFYLNGGTCEPTRTSARCHCTDRYKGDRCEQCSERFQGDGCQECSERFQGDDCQECSERFQGDACQECSERFQGDDCTECSERFQGDDCTECSERFQGDDCKKCSERFQGDDCTECSERFQGDDCTECPERFQGDDCQECSERFHGDGCQGCAPRFQGDECQQCSERFQGDECDTCASGYYGDTCDWSFVEHPNTDCLTGIDLDTLRGFSDDIEPCKEWCAQNKQCGGISRWNGNCNFKGLQCRDDLVSGSAAVVYLKETA